MNLKKKKHLTPKKEDSFLMSLFLSSCFSFQTRTDLVLFKFYYNAAARRFLKTFRKFAGKRLWNQFKQSLSYSKWTQVRVSQNTLLWLFSNIKQKRSVIKDLLKSGSSFLFNAPKYLGARLILFSLRANFTYFLKCILLKKICET